MDELFKLEEESWKTLSSPEEGAARRFYDEHLADDAVMAFPGGMLISGKESILGSFGAQPWKSFQFAEQRVLTLSENAGVVMY